MLLQEINPKLCFKSQKHCVFTGNKSQISASNFRNTVFLKEINCQFCFKSQEHCVFAGNKRSTLVQITETPCFCKKYTANSASNPRNTVFLQEINCQLCFKSQKYCVLQEINCQFWFKYQKHGVFAGN